MNICIYGSAYDVIDRKFIKAGEQLGEVISQHSHTVIYGGGAEGMMGAVARGVVSAKGRIIGIAPSFFKVDGVLFDNCTEFVFTETMRERKKILEERSDGFIVTPGGIGTLDEFFEILSLRQLNRHTKPILLYNIFGYFDPIIDMLHKAADGCFMKHANLELFAVESTPERAIEYMEKYISQKESIEKYR